MSAETQPSPEISTDYSAKTAYVDYAVGEQYEQLRFSGVMGRYRRRSELRAVNAALEHVAPGAEILDCPCGIGRWWPELSQKAGRIVAADISEGMRRHAAERAGGMTIPVEVIEADAEALALPDDAVDWVFSFALTKHLPHPVQHKVLQEFGRVARQGVICTFGVFSHFTYEIWRRRKLFGSFPVLPEQLDLMAREAGLTVVGMTRCTTPIGVEKVVVFKVGA
jgi:ubiquinone/menaquinone biosynthesis C-methylase UbiE